MYNFNLHINTVKYEVPHLKAVGRVGQTSHELSIYMYITLDFK